MRGLVIERRAISSPRRPSKTRRGWRADVQGSHPAAGKSMEAPAGMESPDARKTWGGRRADMDPCSPAKPRDAAAGMETPDARKTWGGRRADVDACGPAKSMQTAASKAGRDRRADAGNSGAVKVMKIAAAKAAVKSAAGKSGGDGRGAGAEIRRGGNAAGANAMRARGAAESMKRRSAAGA